METTNNENENETKGNVKLTCYVSPEVRSTVERLAKLNYRNLSQQIQYMVETHPDVLAAKESALNA